MLQFYNVIPSERKVIRKGPYWLARYINIHSYSSLGEQSTPVTHEFYDAFAASLISAG